MKKRLLTMMAFVLGILTSATAGEKVFYTYPSGADQANLQTLAEGVTVQITSNTSKNIQSGKELTINGTKYLSMKVSNGAQNTLTLPKAAKAITFYSYMNYASTAETKYDCYWKEVAGVNYDAETSGGLMTCYSDGDLSQPDVRKYTFETPTQVITFTNAGYQLAYVIEVEYDGEDPAITFEATSGVEREIAVVMKAVGTVSVDWGDGVLKSAETTDVYYPGYGSWGAAKLTGTPVGTVKVYGDDIQYFEAISKLVDGELTNGLTSIDLSKATELLELDVHMNKLTTVDLSQNTKLQTLSIGANDFETINLDANTELTSLDISATSGGKLTSLDLSKNTKLTKVVLSGNKLTTLDFTNNPLIKTFTVQNNELTSVTIGANTAKNHTFQFGGNKLTSFSLKDASTVTGSYVYLRDNDITEVELPSNVSRMWLDGNALSLSQLYALKQKTTQQAQFTYAGNQTKEQAQQPYAIAESINANETVDLSSQAMLGETATVFTWKKADGTALVEGTDYTVAAGVFTFLTAQEAIHCEMTNAEFPLFTAEKPYMTTAMKVVASGTGINTIAADKANGAWYNLKGQRIDVPSKGLYIHNGKKVVIK